MLFNIENKILLKLFCVLFVSLNSFSADVDTLSDISNGNESPKKLTPHSSPKKKSPEKYGIFRRNMNQDMSCKRPIDFSGEEGSLEDISFGLKYNSAFANKSPNISPTKKYLEKSSSSSSYSSSSNAKLIVKERKKVHDFDSDDECCETSNYDAGCVVNQLASSSVVGAKTDVYISMTTSPARLPNLDFILDQLSPLLESGELKAVYVNLPRNYRNQISVDEKGQVLTYDETKLSSLKQKFGEKIIVTILEHDLGPISKILPTIRTLKDKNQHQALVISIDDDQYYHPQAIQELITYKKSLTDYIFSFAGGPLEHYGLYDDEELSFPGLCVGSMSNQSIIASEESWQEIVSTKESLVNTKRNNYNQAISKTPKENKKDGQVVSPNKSPKADRLAIELEKEDSNLSSLRNARELICQENMFKFCKKGALSTKEQKAVNKKALGMDVDIVEGQACIIYAVNDLDKNDIFLLENLSDKNLLGKDCYLSDDLIISFVLSLNGKNRIYLKKNDELNAWHIACQQCQPLITDGALTHGSGYSEQEVETLGINRNKNNDKIKYKRALEMLGKKLKKDGMFLSKNEMVENLKKNKI